jgi:ribosomal protein S1
MFEFLKNIFGQNNKVEIPIETPKNDYLKQLIDNLKEVKNSDKVIPFVIQGLKPKGFLIKIRGLFGFVPFTHMPWSYKDKNKWNIVAPYLIGHKFYGSIHSLIETQPFHITVDGQKHKFQKLDLEIGVAYECIVIQKTNYGLFLEAGYDFNWEYGSFIGLAHKSTFIDTDEYDNIKKGDTITTYFHGYNTDKKPIFGDEVKDVDFLTGKLDKYINTTVEVTVRKLPNSKNEYFVDNVYPATLSVTKTIYPNDKKHIKEVVANFIDNEKITCEVLGISDRRKKIQLKLIDEYKRIKIR